MAHPTTPRPPVLAGQVVVGQDLPPLLIQVLQELLGKETLEETVSLDLHIQQAEVAVLVPLERQVLLLQVNQATAVQVLRLQFLVPL